MEGVLKQFDKYPYFTKSTIAQLTKLKHDSLTTSINRYISADKLILLKKGYYVTKDYYTRNKGIKEYKEYLASVLKYPSYISTDYVLQEHNILTEATYTVTSVTTKKTNIYENKIATYTYQNLKKELFLGYDKYYYNDKSYFKASLSKALFDYIYFKSFKVKVLLNRNFLEEYRLNLDTLTLGDWEDLFETAKILGNTKVKFILDNIKRNASTTF